MNQLEKLNPNGLFPLQRLKDSSLRAQNLKLIRSLTQRSYLGNNNCICRVLGNYLVFVNTLDERLGIQLQMNGYWEMGVTEFIAQNVKQDMRVLDVGSNYGYFSLLMASLVGKSGKVYALDANPHLCNLLSKSIKVNGFKKQISVINKAISDKPSGTQLFVFNNSTPMNGSLAENKTANAIKTKFIKHIEIETTSLDSIFKKTDRIDFMKIDIEGSEQKLWIGSHEIRKNNPNIIILMEFNRRRYENSELFIKEIFLEGYEVIKLGEAQQNNQLMTEKDLLKSDTSKHMMLVIKKA